MKNHRKGYRKLGLPTHRRMSLLRNLATDLIEKQIIMTTVARAKALKPFIEKLLTKTKEDNPHNRAQLRRVLKTKTAFKAAFEKIGPALAHRPGGYTRIVRASLPRKGDGARLALIELVDRPGQQVASYQPNRAAAQVAEKVVLTVEAPTAESSTAQQSE